MTVGLLERVAAAPISWGVCEVPGWGHQLGPERVMDEIAELGFRATELGPPGFLPSDPHALQSLLAPRGLRLAGGFAAPVLHEPSSLDQELAELTRAADALAAASAGVLVLAAAVAADGYDTSARLDEAGWEALVFGLERVGELAAERGLTVAFHPHYGTAIERPEEVGRLIESTPVPLCVDTGHLLVGGADPAEVTKSAAARVAHVHLKDVSGDFAEKVRTGRMSYAEAVEQGLYRPLGAGDVDVVAVLESLDESGYDGWLVLEQDRVLRGKPERGGGPREDAASSLRYIAEVAERLASDNRRC